MGVRLTVSCVWFVIVHLAFVEDGWYNHSAQDLRRKEGDPRIGAEGRLGLWRSCGFGGKPQNESCLEWDQPSGGTFADFGRQALLWTAVGRFGKTLL